MISIEKVTKSFGEKVAVDDITVTIPSGSITGFIGPNGAGKTTTINMMTGVLKPDTGNIVLDDKNIVSQAIEAKKSFGLVPDSPDLFLRLTGKEYVNFMADLHNVPTDIRKERFDQLANDFGMTEDLDVQMNSYSHGMRQKAIIMGALIGDPDIWILDEPMTGLDPSAAFVLKNKMKEHAAKGKTVFFSTHVLEIAEKLCDKIILICQGKIKFDGTLDALRDQYPNKSLEEIFLEVSSNE